MPGASGRSSWPGRQQHRLGPAPEGSLREAAESSGRIPGFATGTSARTRSSPWGLHVPISADQVVRRTIVFQLGCPFPLKLGNNSLGERLPQLDAPLIKRIDVPKDALCEHAVFVERDEFSEN